MTTSGKAWRAARVPPGRTTLSPDPKGCLGEVSTHATGAETRLAATRSHKGEAMARTRQRKPSDPRARLGSRILATRPKKGRDTRRQQISDSPPKIPGQNISSCNLANSGGQHCSTLPPRQTSTSSLSSTYPKFSNPSTTFDRVALIPTQHGIQRTTARDAPSGPPRPLSSPRASPGSPGSVPALLADGLP